MGRPAEPVGSSLTVLEPAFSWTVAVLVAQADQAPVPSKDRLWTVEPLTIRPAGRDVAVPLAKRIPRVAVPAAEAFTVNWAWAPAALSALQKPVPE
ncbi:hypothetical protein GCM10020220_020640 [Nonomuraea rubra]